MASINSYEDLKGFLESKNGLRMAHIYKPSMLLTVIRAGGKTTKQEIATDFLLRDTKQIDYYTTKIVHPMPGIRLVRDGLVSNDRDSYELIGPISTLTDTQRLEIETILEGRIGDYLETRYPFADSNNDAVPGSVRYQVLKRAAGRCEACGVTSKDTQIDVDHIVPPAQGGSNDISNLQALCRTCNAQKRDRDDTNFEKIHESYGVRSKDCPLCECKKKRVVAENELAFAIQDDYEVTSGHSLVIPKRHVEDYFELHAPERNAIEDLLQRRRESLMSSDRSITGFNVGSNSGISAGQTIMHVHMHLIPRRDGDVDDPRGGIWHVIPEKGNYLASQ